MEVEKLKYPIGCQDFSKIILENYVYIDKTDLIYSLVNKTDYVFLSRPRRFGKSLLLSTIRYYFEGRKELFENLKICRYENEWTSFPVLMLELSRLDAGDKNSLSSIFEQQFRIWESLYNLDSSGLAYAQRFANIVLEAHKATGKKVVILVDEYDNPLINTIHNSEIYEANRELLKSVYSNIKSLDEHIRFVMFTGVSRFSNTSIFSGLNNVTDITFMDEYSQICGFTEQEIIDDLSSGVTLLAHNEECSFNKAMDLLKEEYDGYHFSKSLIDIYNPFSLLKSLFFREISNYWIQSGVPSFLIKKIEESRKSFSDIFNSFQDEISLSASDIAFDSPVALLYQTGYLTIKDYNRQEKLYKVGIPNKEVEKGLYIFLLGAYSFTSQGEVRNDLREMVNSLIKGEPQNFIERMQALLSPISYHLNGRMKELDFERTMYLILHLLGLQVKAEFSVAGGRIDLLIETSQYVYVIELKLDKTAEEALRQIEEKDYSMTWKFDGRKLFKIGINFSSSKRNIDSWIIS